MCACWLSGECTPVCHYQFIANYELYGAASRPIPGTLAMARALAPSSPFHSIFNYNLPEKLVKPSERTTVQIEYNEAECECRL